MVDTGRRVLEKKYMLEKKQSKYALNSLLFNYQMYNPIMNQAIEIRLDD